MKTNREKVKDFKYQYKTILDLEKQISKYSRTLKTSARSLYLEGEKNGISGMKSLQKCFLHLDNICYGKTTH